jgi:catechol 2,3-dioxygenase-like lactoylglutathione lyase family enzyme
LNPDWQLVAFIATSDAPRARRFYENVLDLPLISDDPFALIFDGHGTLLRVQKLDAVSPGPYTALGWTTRDIEADVRALGAKGVTFERYEGMTQDGAGIWTAPDGAKVAWFKDPDGNLLSLSES